MDRVLSVSKMDSWEMTVTREQSKAVDRKWWMAGCVEEVPSHHLCSPCKKNSDLGCFGICIVYPVSCL